MIEISQARKLAKWQSEKGEIHVTHRTYTTDLTGPIVLNASILGIGGHVTVEANEQCTRASVTIRTDDEKGPAADSVRGADLGEESGTLVARVTGEDHGSGLTQSVFNRGGRTTVIQNGNVVSGNVTGVTIINGQVVTGGSSTVQQVSPVEITVIVPVGSSLITHSDFAALATQGPLRQVVANTQSGSVDIADVHSLRAKTMSGRIFAGDVVDAVAETMSGSIEVRGLIGSAKLNTMSGQIEVHAIGGGRINADTMSGRINVTAAPGAIQAGLRVRADSMSGCINIPRQCAR